MTAASGDAQHVRLEAFALWLGLGLAFSPTLVELAGHLAAHPWARYAALFPLLFAVAVRTGDGRPAADRHGVLAIGAGLALELLGILTGIPALGRVGLALAAVGLCRRLGLATWPELALLAFAVPLPSVALHWSSPAAESALAAVASACLGALGMAGVEIVRGAAHYGAQELPLEAFDAGGALLPLLAGLSWYASLRRRVPPRRALGRAAAAALLAFPVQLIAVALALVALRLGSADTGRRILSELPWATVAAVSLAHTEWRLRRGAQPDAL